MGGCGNLSFCEEHSAPVTRGSGSAVTQSSLSFSFRPQHTPSQIYTHFLRHTLLNRERLRVFVTADGLVRLGGMLISIAFSLKSLAKRTDAFLFFLLIHCCHSLLFQEQMLAAQSNRNLWKLWPKIACYTRFQESIRSSQPLLRPQGRNRGWAGQSATTKIHVLIYHPWHKYKVNTP